MTVVESAGLQSIVNQIQLTRAAVCLQARTLSAGIAPAAASTAGDHCAVEILLCLSREQNHKLAQDRRGMSCAPSYATLLE